MKDLLILYTQIALLRRGPQDLPASTVLLVGTVLAYFAIKFAVSSVLPPMNGPWQWYLAVEVVFTLAWYAVLLRIVKKPERYLQTATAVFGYQTVLAPLWIASSWVLQRYSEDELWQYPALLAALALVVWIIAAGGHVLKAALEWSMPACIALVILEILAGEWLLFLLFPISLAH